MRKSNKPLPAPLPILTSLKKIGDPYSYGNFSLDHCFAAAEAAPTGSIDDFKAASKFLFTYQGSSATFTSYRRELERFLQWSWRIEKRSVFTLKREDIERFIRFVIAPPTDWIGEKNAPRVIRKGDDEHPNPEWRPFVQTQRRKGNINTAASYQPSQASIRATFAVLSSFYDYLTEEDLVESNPVALIRQKNKFLKRDQDQAVVRRITNLQWDYVIETAEQLADLHPKIHERTLFVMNCLLAMYLRISELVADERSTPLMGDFRKDQDSHWWFHVTGKGNKDRTIAVSNAMMRALRRYRLSRGLSALPTLGEKNVLIPKARGNGPINSTRQIRRIVQDCFDAAYARMKEAGLEDDAHDLRAATVHWLRHTGISEDVKLRPREHVRDDAGHASMATTDRYIESDRRERHASGRKKPIKDL